MSTFTHLNELGEKIYEEVVHDIESIEAWINQHFGSTPVPEGHTILKDGEPEVKLEAPVEDPKPEEHKDEDPKPEEHKDDAPVPEPSDLIPETRD